jgi:D-alanine-D-alanine ligase
MVGSLVIKPACDGSSAGLAFLKDAPSCKSWFETHATSSDPWLAEEELIGRELTVGVVMHRGLLTALPPSEVILDKNARFDFQAKYHGVGNREITPADLSATQCASAQAVSLIAHAAIGCFGYTRTDMIMTAKGIYYLETNTLPGMTKASFIPQQLRAAGIDLRDFVESQVELAKKRYD